MGEPSVIGVCDADTDVGVSMGAPVLGPAKRRHSAETCNVLTHEEQAREQLRNIRRTALDALARREHSTLELRRKLNNKFGSGALVEQVVQKLTDEKLLCDERFAESYIHYRSRSGFGPQRIAQELSQRGVSSVIADSLLRDVRDWGALARQVRCKKFGEGAPLDNKEKQRQMQFLRYRGFPYDIIDAVID